MLIDAGEKPSVLSAVMKQQTTERCCENVINRGMDILGGGGICLGDNNFFNGNYTQAPGITVEGSNTLTRSLIIFGQGLMRSHPFIKYSRKHRRRQQEEIL